MSNNTKRAVLIVLIAAVIAIAAALYFKREAEIAEEKLAITAGQVLSESFEKASSLKVATLSGQVVVMASDPGWRGLLPSSQKMKAPYSVDYFIDLRQLSVGAYRWNRQDRSMVVTIPPVGPAAPNIDESKAEVGPADGLWVGRRANVHLRQQLSKSAGSVAQAAAAKAENFEKARASAREAVSALVRGPLAAAGIGSVTVAVRFADDPVPDGERWDESVPMSEILAERAPG